MFPCQKIVFTWKQNPLSFSLGAVVSIQSVTVISQLLLCSKKVESFQSNCVWKDVVSCGILQFLQSQYGMWYPSRGNIKGKSLVMGR